MNKKFKEREIQFVLENYSFHGIKYCVDNLNLTKKQIQGIASRHRIKMNREIRKTQVRDTINENLLLKLKNNTFNNIDIKTFIGIETKEIAYVLGLLWADGWICKKYNRVSCQLLKPDMDELISIFKTFGKWKIHNRKVHSKIQTQIYLTNKILYRFLQDNDYHIKSGTSPDKILKIIPNKYKHYWWRGYLDGDGCIYLGKDKNTISFTSTYEQNWDFFFDLSSFLDIKITKRLVERTLDSGKINRSSEISIMRKNDCKKFCDYIYNNFLDDKIGLSRKYKKYIGLCERCQQ